jgi:hypothetical protein
MTEARSDPDMAAMREAKPMTESEGVELREVSRAVDEDDEEEGDDSEVAGVAVEEE